MKYRCGPVDAALFCVVLATLFPPDMAVADDQDNATGKPMDNAPLPPSSAQDQAAWPGNASRWTVSVGGILLGRLGGGVNRTLVARVPGSVPFLATSIAPGTEAFNSNQFQQGLSAGPGSA